MKGVLYPTQRLRRFFVAGTTAFALEYSAFFVLFSVVKLPILAAHSFSFGCGLITSFLLNRQWTFRQTQFKHRKTSQFSLYLLLALFNLAITNILLHSLGSLGLNPYAGKLLVMVLVAGWNFLLYRSVIFKPTTQEQ